MSTGLNGVIENATGDLIRAGYKTMTANLEIETIMLDIPDPAFIRKRRNNEESPNKHNWTGNAWVLIPQ